MWELKFYGFQSHTHAEEKGGTCDETDRPLRRFGKVGRLR